ncbi:MAG: RdgB/HAM1 family non-canonical purine NTP pyrophosphatase [Candidatus Omnitrophica bacterium]|nr:RdgB/HAM1 family non-canonical purine NTP pyrophosphatase [Candidatus Omnitrophota bacterium]
MTNILIATHNLNKRKEIKTLLKDFSNIKVLSLDDIKIDPPRIVEDGKTFRQNAVKKAVITSQFVDGLVLADDSGLVLDILGGKPGVRSARFARKHATDIENNKKLLKLLEKMDGEKRAAKFVCHITLATKGKLLENFEGVIWGMITKKGRGQNGFGYDPIFVPDGYNKTFAQMTAAYKNKISHRALALKQLKEHIQKYIN